MGGDRENSRVMTRFFILKLEEWVATYQQREDPKENELGRKIQSLILSLIDLMSLLAIFYELNCVPKKDILTC